MYRFYSKKKEIKKIGVKEDNVTVKSRYDDYTKYLTLKNTHSHYTKKMAVNDVFYSKYQELKTMVEDALVMMSMSKLCDNEFIRYCDKKDLKDLKKCY